LVDRVWVVCDIDLGIDKIKKSGDIIDEK